MNRTEIDLGQLKKNYSFHDGNVDDVTILPDDVILMSIGNSGKI